jgi:hypothetical protein
MKSTFTALLLLVLPALGFAQGALAPTAAPGPTMKTLTQIEPRTPLGSTAGSTTTLTVNAAGTYVLMGNVTVTTGDAIVITADNVTLDLNGFTLASTAATPAGYGIRLGQTSPAVKTASNARIFNGRVNAAKFAHGVAVDGASFGIILSDISVAGATQAGLNAGTTGSEVNRCTVSNCLATGITASTVRDSSATACGGTGITATGTALRSTASTTGDSAALKADMATDCTGASAAGIGVEVAKIATNCTGSSVTGTGLTAINAVNCSGTGSGAGKFGINVTGTASYCRASCPNGTALKALVAIGCSLGSGTTAITNKYEMP